MTIFSQDEDLLIGFRAGTREALSTVYRHYVDAVAMLLWRCLDAGRDVWRRTTSVDISHVVQDVFIKAFSTPARAAYHSGREYRPFLMAIARNALVDHLRGASREVRLERSDVDTLTACGQGSEDAAPWIEPSTVLLAERYVAGLGDPARGVYLERYVRCRSQEQSALALGLSRQQVRTIEGKLRAGLARAISRAGLGTCVSSRHLGASASGRQGPIGPPRVPSPCAGYTNKTDRKPRRGLPG